MFWPGVDFYFFYIFKKIGQGNPEHQVIKLVWPEYDSLTGVS